MKRTLINYLGLSGVVAFLSYLAAVVFSPFAYPGYDRLAQAVSDLSAETAPSRILWGQLSALYDVCGVVCATLVCVFVKGRLSKTIRIGLYLFTAMWYISALGYRMFPLSESGSGGAAFQDVMHVYVVTVLVVLLSVASLILIMIGGFRNKKHRLIAVFAAVALGIMLVGAIGTNVAPKEIFGLFERFSTFSAVGFLAVLGVYLFFGFGEKTAIEKV